MKNRNLEIIKYEVEHYKPRKPIRDTMLALGRMGFSFFGHGTDLSTGTEDFSLGKRCKKGEITVELSTDGKSTVSLDESIKGQDRHVYVPVRGPKSALTLARKFNKQFA